MLHRSIGLGHHREITMNWLHNIRLQTKFIILGVIALIMVVVPSALYLQMASDEIAVAEREAVGTGPVIAVLKVVQFSQTHRGMSASMLSGNQALEARRPGMRDKVNAAMTEVDTQFARTGVAEGLRSRWAAIRQTWTALEQAVASKSIETPESTARHTALITLELQFAEELLDEFGLSLDPEADSYALMRASFIELPWLTENLGILRAMGSAALTRKAAAPEYRATLAGLHKRASELKVSMTRQFERAAGFNPEMQQRLGAAATQEKTAVEQALALVQKEIIQAPPDLSYEAVNYFDTYTRTIDGLFAFNEQASLAMIDELQTRVSSHRRSMYLLGGLFLGGLVLAFWLALQFTRSITGPLRAGVQMAERVAQGDLTAQVHPQGSDELAELLNALRTMRDNLDSVVRQVSQAADALATASAEIAQGDNDLSARTESQASALEQTNASMEELGGRIHANAEAAQQANKLAQDARTVATQGGEVVGQVVSTMREINESSRRIADIVSMIDGIAFQTNILALNAAVEAARAGEQGRGFAVVAGEVRSLAQRSAEAAREIKALIDASVQRVEHGSTLVDQAGGTMGEVVTSIQRVADLVGEISASSREQAQGVAQVVEAVGQMDSTTQQNAALVEEIAAAASSLKTQSEQLVQTISHFRL